MAYPSRIRRKLYHGVSAIGIYTGGGTNYIVETPTGAVYIFLIDANVDPAYIKSTDYGLTWSDPVALKNCNCVGLAVWYDRWTDPTGVLGDLIHVAYTDSTSDDVFYRNIDTASSDALGTERTVFAGTSTANGGAISIARMRGGNLVICGSIDAGAEIYNKKSTDLFATSNVDINAAYEANADLCIVMPGWGADNQDAMMFYYDRSGTEVSVKYYDDSADSWSEASLATTIAIPDHTSATLGHMSATVDHTNSQNLIAFWTAVDAGNADLRVFKCTQSAQTETTSNVVLNSTDDQGMCGIAIVKNTRPGLTTDDWYVFFIGASDGVETYYNNVLFYYKKSSDGGVNWSSQTEVSGVLVNATVIFCNPFIYYNYYLFNYDPLTRFGYSIEQPLYKSADATGGIGG